MRKKSDTQDSQDQEGYEGLRDCQRLEETKGTLQLKIRQGPGPDPEILKKILGEMVGI